MLAGRRNTEWGFYASNPADGVRPAAGAGMGVSVTPAQNAYGSFANLLLSSDVTSDIWLWTIAISNVGISTQARDAIITIGVDEAGGTSYTDYVTDIVCGPAPILTQGIGTVRFTFPLIIKASASVGVKASVNSATLTAFQVGIDAWGLPSHPENARAGSYCQTLGATPASSAGTAVTDGGASESAWTQLGTLTLPCWAIEYGIGLNSGNAASAIGRADISIGDATNKRIVIHNAASITNVSEVVAKEPALWPCNGAIGDIVYGRLQTSNNTAGRSMAAYAIGG